MGQREEETQLNKIYRGNIVGRESSGKLGKM